MRTTCLVLPLVASLGCNSGHGGDTGTERVEHYGCVHIVEGDIVDASADREGATEIRVGRVPYRVNLKAGAPGFVKFTSGSADLVLLVDFAGAAKAVWNGDDRVAIDPGDPDPNCDADLPEVDYFSVSGGDHWLELGPAYTAAVWMMLGEN